MHQPMAALATATAVGCRPPASQLWGQPLTRPDSRSTAASLPAAPEGTRSCCRHERLDHALRGLPEAPPLAACGETPGDSSDRAMVALNSLPRASPRMARRSGPSTGLLAEPQNPSAFAQLRNILDPCAGCFKSRAAGLACIADLFICFCPLLGFRP